MTGLLLLSLFTFTSFDGAATLKFLQRYSLSMIFMKCTKTGEAIIYCEELVVVAFVQTNIDALFDSILKTKG